MVTLYGGLTFDDNQRPITGVNERTANPQAINLALSDKIKAESRVAMPAKVVSFNAAKQTIEAQPLVREKILDKATGSVSFVNLPNILDVPVCFPQAGPFVLTMPVQAGDEVLLVFADLCIDSWWAKGGVQGWNDRRRHDLSDAIAVVGINSVPNVVPDIANDAAELRTKDRKTVIRLQETGVYIHFENDNIASEVYVGDGGVSIAVTDGDDSAGVGVTPTNVTINGSLIINGIPYIAHIHSGVTPGPGTTGGVVVPP